MVHFDGSDLTSHAIGLDDDVVIRLHGTGRHSTDWYCPHLVNRVDILNRDPEGGILRDRDGFVIEMGREAFEKCIVIVVHPLKSFDDRIRRRVSCRCGRGRLHVRDNPEGDCLTGVTNGERPGIGGGCD